VLRPVITGMLIIRPVSVVMPRHQFTFVLCCCYVRFMFSCCVKASHYRNAYLPRPVSVVMPYLTFCCTLFISLLFVILVYSLGVPTRYYCTHIAGGICRKAVGCYCYRSSYYCQVIIVKLLLSLLLVIMSIRCCLD